MVMSVQAVIVMGGFAVAGWAAFTSNPALFFLGITIVIAGGFFNVKGKAPLQFDDGWSPNVQGDYRVIKGPDGLYVVGQGLLMPVDSYEEGQNVIRELKAKEQKHGHA